MSEPGLPMNREEYVFNSNEQYSERNRLAALQEVHDPMTKQFLALLELGSGKTCAEIGAGEGSIARHMVDLVAPDGRVIGLDINTRLLEVPPYPGLEIRRGDITKDALEPCTYDLIHERFVLLHLNNIHAALSNLKQALKPGGILFIEEPDFRTAFPAAADGELSTSIARVNRAVLSMYSSMGVDPALGSKLPSMFLEHGFNNVGFSTELPLAPGGSPIAKMMSMSIQYLRSRLIDTGDVSESDIESYIAALAAPRVWATYYATTSVYGTKS
jgi:ubiquinone/menaquinone biosynthesis C-methylase UbiE